MELQQQFEQEFEKLKKELKFETTLKELNEIFFLNDYIQERKYVSENLARQISDRIVGLFNGWTGYLQGLLMPNPSSMVHIMEANLFDDAEKAEFQKIMASFMQISSKSAVIGLTKDKKLQAQFIDEAVQTWNKHKPTLITTLTHLNEFWKNKSNPKEK